ncbi:MAG: hypothetical protein F4Y45_07405 [Acidobacteria bacterium]|nr:hypothetical protein [Acidobacteriota bacterium]MXZ70406.1 hypothetical protein [Acidobacteriota bacterium]MYD70773.1 hypothetical protein [Acidobacteriota bacterium]MYJ06327.1 hypothetical protein [Acidobacteriota bacterium]
MTKRQRTVVSVLIACLALTPLAANGQSAAESSLRTPWGDPDLQGIWNNSTLTPFQRPEHLADREFLTEEEAADIEQTNADRNADLAGRPALRTEADPSGNVDRGVDGAPGSYNNFWMERGTTVVATRRTSIVTDPPNGRLPEPTPAVAAWLASPEAARLADVRGGRLPTDHYDQLDGGDRCLWYRGIPSFPTAYNNHYQIVQTPSWVAILQEHIHDVRFIALDGRPHIDPAIRQFAGDSRGRWEGDTLIVETTHFNNQAFIRNFNANLTEDLHVIERFRRADGDTLDYEFTVTDPNVWTRPWSGSLPMWRAEGPVFEYACHEGNYGLTNMLAGSRAEDAAGGR